LSFSKQARRTFHDVPYMLTVSGDNDGLGIEVEHAESGERWSSKFAASFIEEITQRTGNAKKFDVFVRMMLSALAQESDSVYIDVLTARDLEMLRRRNANPQGPPTTSTAGISDKRYLILTYRAEFDKVHYPLPLPPDDRSEEETLRALVLRLRGELAEARRQAQETTASNASGIDFANAKAQPAPREDIRILDLQRQTTELSDALRASKREAELLRNELRHKAVTPSAGAVGGSGGGAEVIEVNRLKGQNSKMQAELKAAKEELRQRELQQRRECERLEKELRGERQKAERLQLQVRRLEEEKKALNERLRLQGARGQSAERRAPSRTPSADRGRPPSQSRPSSRPISRSASRPPSRSSSIASSRERTPSPGAGGRGGGNGARPGPSTRNGEAQPWTYQRSNSPAGGLGNRRSERQTSSPGATLSPYRRSGAALATAGRRTPSPGQRGRERTPSPGQVRGAAAPGPNASALGRPPMSLREPRGGAGLGASGGYPTAASPAPAAAGGRGLVKPASGRYGSGARPSSAAAVPAPARDRFERARSGSRGPDDGEHRPGSLFGLAANLGLGPGSLNGTGLDAGAAGPGAAPVVTAKDVEACDIDARLQALQSFLKQTKNVAG